MVASSEYPVPTPARRLLSPLRLRLLGMVAIAFVPVTLLIARLAADERASTLLRARDSAMRLLDSAAVEQRELTRSGLELLRSLGARAEVATGAPAACVRELSVALDPFPNYRAATRVRVDGTMDCSTEPFTAEQANVSSVESMRLAAESQQTVAGFYRVGLRGQPLATLVEPIRDEIGRVRFYLGMEVELPWLQRLTVAAEPTPGTVVSLVDGTGYILARVPDPEQFARTHRQPSAALLEMTRLGSGIIEARGLDSRARLYAFRRLPAANAAPVFLSLGMPLDVVYADANRQLRANVLVGIVTLILAMMMAWIASELFVIRDVGKLLGATERLADGDLSTRVPALSGGGELQDLAQRFNDLARRLEDRRREFFVLGDSSPDLIARIGRDMKIDWANVAVREQLKMSLDDLAGMPVELVPIESPLVPRTIAHLRNTLSSGVRREVEEHIVSLSGDTWIDMRFVPERDAAGEVTHVMLIVRDVSARKSLEMHLAQSERLDSIGKLAGSISHDFNNLLTAIIGNAEIALRGLDPGHRVRADITEILDVARRASSLTRQLLSFARRQPTTPKVIEVKPFIEETAALLRRLMGARISLVLRLDPASPRIRFDPTHFEQVLVNLATNARDAMPQGGTLTVSTSPAMITNENGRAPNNLAPGEYLLLAVMDTGVGMSPEVRQRIFEPFFTTKRDHEGTGLGLAVTYGIVRQHGGSIEVDSVEGQGTTFRIYFPATREKPEAKAPAVVGPSAPTGRETILLVEDQDHVRVTIARLLRSHGYSVLEARDGVDAMQVFNSAESPTIHMVVTDLVMPRMDGEGLVTSLRAEQAKVPILLISGYDDKGSARRMIDRGDAAALLEKPFEAQPFLTLIRDLLDEANARVAAPR